jgi:5-methylcytosine-specific restriction endonuclease McrA
MSAALIQCENCSLFKPNKALGLCLKCYHKSRFLLNPEKFRNHTIKYSLKNREKELKRYSDYYKKNKARKAEYQKSKRKENPKEHAFRSSLYRGNKARATLNLYLEDLRKVYRECPKGLEVDHIVPLKGRNVCGLHAPWNLQYLTPENNRKKSNKLTEDSWKLAA